MAALQILNLVSKLQLNTYHGNHLRFLSSLFSTRLSQHSSECGVLLGLQNVNRVARSTSSSPMIVAWACKLHACMQSSPIPHHRARFCESLSTHTLPKSTLSITYSTLSKQCSRGVVHTQTPLDSLHKGLEQSSVPNPTTKFGCLYSLHNYPATNTLSCRLCTAPKPNCRGRFPNALACSLSTCSVQSSQSSVDRLQSLLELLSSPAGFLQRTFATLTGKIVTDRV